MEGPVAPHSIYPHHGVRALILFSSFHLAGNLHFLPPRTPTVCLSRFLLKSRWWLYSPGPHPLPDVLTSLTPPPPALLSNFTPISFPPTLVLRIVSPSRPSFLVVSHEPAATSSSAIQRQSSIYGEITLRWPIIENMPSNNAPSPPSSPTLMRDDSRPRERNRIERRGFSSSFFLYFYLYIRGKKKKKKERKKIEKMRGLPRFGDGGDGNYNQRNTDDNVGSFF